MLKILWVEDQLGGKQTELFGDRPVTLITNFDDAERMINTVIDEFDIVVLDIDLDQSEVTDNVRKHATSYELEASEFLKESGMTLFLTLLEKGFPKERIVFLTANSDKKADLLDKLQRSHEKKDFDSVDNILDEIQNGLGDEKVDEYQKLINTGDMVRLISYLKEHYGETSQSETPNTYNRFCDAYKRCRIQPPGAINKNLNDVKQHVSEWLDGHEANQYLVLRRGIIEGCQKLKKLKDKLRFSKFVVEGKIAFLDAEDYLDALEIFLPLREPNNKTTLYKHFVRTLAHEWEESVEAKKFGDDQVTFAFSWIMKMTRNWMAHNSTAIFNSLSEQDLAYLFICNMRAIFELSEEIMGYEEILLSLFSKEEESEALEKAELIVKEKRIPLVKSYVSYFNEKTKRTQVHNILHELQNNKAKLKSKGDTFFITGLYHSFWFLTSEHDDKKDKAKENRDNPSQVFISRYYTFCPYNYTQYEFLFKFSSHIYHRSFSQGEPA